MIVTNKKKYIYNKIDKKYYIIQIQIRDGLEDRP